MSKRTNELRRLAEADSFHGPSQNAPVSDQVNPEQVPFFPRASPRVAGKSKIAWKFSSRCSRDLITPR